MNKPKNLPYRKYVAVRDNVEDFVYHIVDSVDQTIVKTFTTPQVSTKQETYRRAMVEAGRLNMEHFQTRREVSE